MSISLDQVTKRYQGSPVVNDVSLEVGDGEFYVLLGPSGSGKSTLLRAVAGLTGVDHGRISLHGRDVTHVSARERGVGLVFQHYALFRHMTVAENIEFALRVRRVKAAERRERRKELLRLVSLEGMDDRLPTQLSGGQQQRIAVARALAHKPEVLLLDEPFGALDAKIREELRRTIRAVQRELGITTVLVTHDQEEAFALADRIGVMNLGRLLESGKPSDLYARPATRFVATFLGAANLLLARQTPEGVRFGAAAVNINSTDPSLEGCREHEVVALLRPEEVELGPAREKLDSDYIAQGSVDEIVFTGGLERVRVQLDSGSGAPRLTDFNNGNGEEIIEVTRTQPQQRAFPLSPGQTVSIGVRRVHILPTPLSSFTVCASSPEAAQELKSNPLLAELAGRMKTRVAVRVEPESNQADSADRLSGVCILPAGAQAVNDTQRLLRNGAAEVLILPRQSPPPQRVLIYWADATVRRATLAVAASMLRHLAAEAVYFGIMPADTPQNKRSSGVRTLLDARSEAQAMHGLEMRTELLFGDPAQELHRRLNEAPGQLLILGLSDSADLEGRFRSLVNEPRWPVLVVHRPALDIAA